MLYRTEKGRDGRVRLYPHLGERHNVPLADVDRTYLSAIDICIESLRASLWPLNRLIHENPELAFEEYKTHDALTAFMQSHKGWQVTRSAYGIDTAWVAVYSSERAGPVVSFNAEMGTAIV
jgi:hypothetical protein